MSTVLFQKQYRETLLTHGQGKHFLLPWLY